LRYFCLYRFQGSVLTARAVSLCILSLSQRKVNTFFKLFSPFFITFSISRTLTSKENPIIPLLGGTFSRSAKENVREFWELPNAL